MRSILRSSYSYCFKLTLKHPYNILSGAIYLSGGRNTLEYKLDDKTKIKYECYTGNLEYQFNICNGILPLGKVTLERGYVPSKYINHNIKLKELKRKLSEKFSVQIAIDKAIKKYKKDIKLSSEKAIDYSDLFDDLV